MLQPKSSPRILSIDVFRALTMFLMIFVNDIWSVSNVPHRLEHAEIGEDFLGFADVIFPLFLFILGMAIPFAIENRKNKGESDFSISKHIVFRSLAMIIMGLFTVNYSSLDKSIMNKSVFLILILTGFFLTWNHYPAKKDWLKYFFKALQVIGIVLLLYLAFIFRDTKGAIMQPKWWGILGLIGWTYLICAFIYLLIRQNIKYQIFAFLFFTFFCIAEANNWLGILGGILPGKGAHHAFTMCGIVLSLLLCRYSFKQLLPWLTIAGILFLISGRISNHFWIIAKIGETPPFLFYCTGISVLAYICIYWLVEEKNKYCWFRCIEPAGTATLTCYLIPYWLYMIFTLTNFSVHSSWLIYPFGLLKCILFSFICIWMAYGLGKIGIKLKI